MSASCLCSLPPTPKSVIVCQPCTTAQPPLNHHRQRRLANAPPPRFQVGVREVIQGWDLGILGGDGIPPMKEGGKRLLVIPSGGRLTQCLQGPAPPAASCLTTTCTEDQSTPARRTTHANAHTRTHPHPHPRTPPHPQPSKRTRSPGLRRPRGRRRDPSWRHPGVRGGPAGQAALTTW
jgi:hypothetical protein